MEQTDLVTAVVAIISLGKDAHSSLRLATCSTHVGSLCNLSIDYGLTLPSLRKFSNMSQNVLVGSVISHIELYPSISFLGLRQFTNPFGTI